MITMQEAELRIYLRRMLRQWEHEHNAVHHSGDARYICEWVDNYYDTKIKQQQQNDSAKV